MKKGRRHSYEVDQKKVAMNKLLREADLIRTFKWINVGPSMNEIIEYIFNYPLNGLLRSLNGYQHLNSICPFRSHEIYF